jgi:hypothetical protein
MPKEANEAEREKESHGKHDRDPGPNTVISNAQDCPKKFVPTTPFPDRLATPKKDSMFNDILEVFKLV